MTHASPRISIIMPVYNGGDVLVQAVQSILSQTYADFEFLIINDGSTDNALASISTLKDRRIHIIGDNKRRGLAARLNQGITAARAPFIARMDADDIALPHRLEKQLAFLETHPEIDLVSCRAALFDSKGVIGILPFADSHEQICARPWQGFPMPHPTWMGRTAWFQKHSYAIPEVIRAEDQDVLLRSYEQSRFACLDEVLLLYSVGKFSLSKNLTARIHLWCAQMRYFAEHRQVRCAIYSSLMVCMRIIKDFISALPFGRHLMLSRMKTPVPPEIIEQWRATQNKKQKLLFLLSEDWFFCSHFIERAAAAQLAGYDVVIMTHMGSCEDKIHARGLRTLPLNLNRRSLHPIREISTITQIARTYRTENPDIVHHVALKPVLYGSIAARLAGVRHVINAPVGMGYIFISCSLKACLLRVLVTMGLRFALTLPGSKVIFENKDDCQSFINQKIVRPDDAILIRGAGIDTNHFQATPEPAGIPVITLTARMLWDKGIGEFVEAARLLRARGIRARFLLVGAPDPLNSAMIDEATLKQWQSEGIIEWLGYRSDIANLLNQSHIICLPSYREGLPKSLLEALACGRPVVTTDVPGCRETVRHGENGLLVPARDAAALADALADLIASPEKRARMGQKSREMAEQEFSQAQIIAETLDIYKIFG